MKTLAPLLLILSAIAFSADATKPSMAPDFGAVPTMSNLTTTGRIYAQTGTTMVDNRKTVEKWAKENGKALVTKAECEEVVKALEIPWGHAEPDIGMVDAVYISEATRLRREADRIEQREKDRKWALEVIEKWRKRADAIKEVKP